jgi:hypothetical protein
MQKHSTAKGRKGSTSKRDPLQQYRERARIILNLFFNPDTPDFIRDLISGWMTTLENETQVHYSSSRAVAEAFLPEALRAADLAGLDVEDPSSGLVTQTLRECADAHGGYDEREPTERERLHNELRLEAAAFAALINSKHLPEDVRYRIGTLYDELTDGAHSDCETILAQYPAALLKMKVAEEGGAGSHG